MLSTSPITTPEEDNEMAMTNAHLNHNNCIILDNYWRNYNNCNLDLFKVNDENAAVENDEIIIKSVRFKRALQVLWLPFSIDPSSIADGDFVVCRTDDGINIGVIESINTRGNDSPSSSSPSSNHHEDDYDTPCGEILGLASCEEMELFQNKLKKESYLLEICQDYLHEYQELATDIEIIDIEFLMNGSVNIYYYPLQESGGYNSPKHSQSLSSLFKPFLLGIEFQLIPIKSLNLLKSCKSFIDLLTCSSISTIGDDCSYYNQLSTADYLSLQYASDSD